MECYEQAEKVLKKNIKVLHQLAETLLVRESLSGEDIDQIIQVGAPA
jgi:ATP-dependent Zn protease